MANEEMPTAGDGPALGRGFMLWQIANGWQRMARAALGPTGLTYVQAILLAGLADSPAGGVRVSQAGLAQSLGADAMMTSQVLRTLEAAGLVRRDRDPADTRARTLALTAEGKAKLAQALPLLAATEESFFAPLGKKEERFVKSLRRLWRKRRLAAPPAVERGGATDAVGPQAPRKRRPRKAAPRAARR